MIRIVDRIEDAKYITHSGTMHADEVFATAFLSLYKRDIDLFRTRMFGNKVYVDIEICLDENLTLKEAHDIAESLHDKLEKKFDKVKHVMVHVNPASKKDISK